MVVVLALTPVTTPVLFTVAMPVFALLHMPPPGVQLRVVVPVTHTNGVPVMAPGSAFTVTIIVRWQPVVAFLQMMVAFPAPAPVTMPLSEPTVATEVLVLLHVQPVVVVFSVVVSPTHSDALPVIAAGSGFTVTVAVL